MEHPKRTRIKKDIICEFLPPRRASGRVMIFLPGAPGYPNHRTVMEFYTKKGWWFFEPRYRGTWESDGRFLRYSPEKDLRDMLDTLPRGFTDIYSRKKFHVQPSKIVVIGASFGGPAALLASQDPRIDKIICISPVVDWTAPSKDEPLDRLERFMGDAFKNGYRYGANAWKKLAGGTFYNPMAHTDIIDGSKILIFHARDDHTVHFAPVQRFAKRIQCNLVILNKGGHLSASDILTTSRFARRIANHIKRT